jgi:crotonobetainyl-CoA:carnitine CoA-transferase CaiB-like acyl-CoA transferase
MRPLEGLLVLEFAQYLSGPFAGLKLSDLGARVIKIERPGTGDPCRGLFISAPVDGQNTLFHAINRGKESFTADLRNPEDRARLTALMARADVLIQNFRPGVIERQGYGYDEVRALNPRLVYASISGFGDTDWRDLPGQDLLAQSRSGLVWLTGSRDDPPVPMGLAVADMLAGEVLAQGILAALLGRERTGQGAHVETSLLEALLSFQFEVLTTHFNDGGKPPVRAASGGAHPYVGAPYGLYRTADGWLALAMTPSLAHLGELMGIDLAPFEGESLVLRDEIKATIAAVTPLRPTADWLARLQPSDIWCAEVMDWAALRRHPVWAQLGMERRFAGDAFAFAGIAGPLRVNGMRPAPARAAPALGADTDAILSAFGLSGPDETTGAGAPLQPVPELTTTGRMT